MTSKENKEIYLKELKDLETKYKRENTFYTIGIIFSTIVSILIFTI